MLSTIALAVCWLKSANEGITSAMVFARKISALIGIALTFLLAACGASQPATAPAAAPTAIASMPEATGAPTAIAGMGHGAMQPTAMAGMAPSSMPMGTGTVPYDAQFMDSMIMHHQGAIDMANQALKEAQKPEIKTLAENIVKAQQSEIAQMQGWRTAWYPNLAPTGGMSMAMGAMMIGNDANKPFDQRFIEAMILHHQGAIAMAKDAQQKAEHPEIKTLAGNIITAQEREIAQMQQWSQQWFGK